MKGIRFIPLGFALLFTSLVMGQSFTTADVAVSFSSDGSIADEICKSIVKTQGDVLILGSKFSNKSLEKCIVRIQQSGRVVRLILDSKFLLTNSAKIMRLAKSKVCIYSDSNHNAAHNKVIVFGDNLVFSGSYNFTAESDKFNAENGIFIKSTEINRAYKNEFYKHLKHSGLINSKFAPPDHCSNL